MATVSFYLPYLINGVTFGLLLALVALGFVLILGVMEVVNMAHGSMFALGAYIALLIVSPEGGLPQQFGWLFDFPLSVRLGIALVVSPLIVFLVGMGLELCVRRTYGKDHLYGLLLTFGAAFVLEELIRIYWGSSERFLPIPAAISGGFIADGIIYSVYRFYAAGFAIIVTLLLWLFLERTPYGAIIKAGVYDSEMVRALGINIKVLRMLVFGLGAALAALAGIAMVPLWGLRPHIGLDAIIPAFVIVALGGIGSFWGAVIAAVLIGAVTGLTAAFHSGWSMVSMYILLVIVMSFRVRGLSGKISSLE